MSLLTDRKGLSAAALGALLALAPHRVFAQPTPPPEPPAEAPAVDRPTPPLEAPKAAPAVDAPPKSEPGKPEPGKSEPGKAEPVKPAAIGVLEVATEVPRSPPPSGF